MTLEMSGPMIHLRRVRIPYARLCDASLDYSSTISVLHYRQNPVGHTDQLRKDFGICPACEVIARREYDSVD